VLSENDCVCKVNYQLNASGDCEALSSCVQGFVYTVSFCKEICGDGLLFELECDDGNSDDGDGCSATCTIETNFTCKDGSPTTPSKCSYNKPIELELKKSVKDIYNNAVTFTISTFPQLRVLNAFNFSQILSSNLPT
jgi:cysteine-rich repeat protein